MPLIGYLIFFNPRYHFSQTELAQLGSYLYLKGIRFASACSKLPNLYSDPASAQVVIGALKVTKVSLFTVIPPLPRW